MSSAGTNDVISKAPLAEKPAGEVENHHDKKNGGGPEKAKMVDAEDDDNLKRRLSEDSPVAGNKRPKTELEEVLEVVPEQVKDEVAPVDDNAVVVAEPVLEATANVEPVEGEEKEISGTFSDLPALREKSAPSDALLAEVASPETPVETKDEAPAEESVINLDSTVESECGELAANTEGNIADDDETLNKTDVAEEDESIMVVADDPLPKDGPIGKVPEMDVTLEVTKDALDTPNSSICPVAAAGQLLVSAVAPHLMLSNGSSTPNSNNATSVEFQATPIKKSIEESIEELHAEGKTSSVVDSSSQDTLSTTTDDKTKSSADGKLRLSPFRRLNKSPKVFRNNDSTIGVP